MRPLPLSIRPSGSLTPTVTKHQRSSGGGIPGGVWLLVSRPSHGTIAVRVADSCLSPTPFARLEAAPTAPNHAMASIRTLVGVAYQSRSQV